MTRLAFLLLIFVVACEQKQNNHPVFKYYPASSVFKDGYVNKYYRHYYPKNTDSRAGTEINYSKYRREGDRILVERYNAGFDLAGMSEFRVSGAKVITERLIDIWRSDTTNIEVVDSLNANWEETTEDEYKLRFLSRNNYYSYHEKQLDVYDTLVDGKAGRVFVREGKYQNEETEEVINQFVETSIYLTDLGYFHSTSDYDTYTIENELIEQMSVDDFEQRAGHSKHRIAWIDPENTLDEEGIEICGHERFIADYYNSTPDGSYIHGKRALLDTIEVNLDEAKLLEQNGLLIFRFVVNCEGKAGRFTVDGYDFMYEPIKFEQESIDHLYGILRKLEDWRPVVINDEARDAYFYITFKIEDGKIIDILP